MLLLAFFPLATLPAHAQADSAPAFQVGQYAGKVVLVDFWASWCAPCKESFPWMQRMHERYASQGLVIVAVNVDHDRALAERFLARQRPGFQVVYDPHGDLAEQYRVSSMPASYLYSRGGEIRFRHSRANDEERAQGEREIVALLQEAHRQP
jgi:thiol-disulfide isomerase/thioredoxin